MKKILNATFILVILLMLVVGCGAGDNNQTTPPAVNNPPNATTPESPDNTPDSTPKPMQQDGADIEVSEGVFVIGEYLTEGQYILTTNEDSMMNVIVFDSQDNYNNYNDTSRVTNGEESAAIEKYARNSNFLWGEQSIFISLKNGFVLKLSSGDAIMTKISLGSFNLDIENDSTWDSSNAHAIASGIFFVGDDLIEGQYTFTVVNADWGMNFIVFETRTDYINYFRTSRFTNGEERDAIDANSSLSEYLYDGNNYSVNLKDGNVLMLKGGIGELKMSGQDSTEISFESDDVFILSGFYIVGDDIAPGSYAFTCLEADWGMNFTVFENLTSYLGYQQASRFTNGEERAAIEQNALFEISLYAGNTGFANLKTGMIIMTSIGIGLLETADPSWGR